MCLAVLFVRESASCFCSTGLGASLFLGVRVFWVVEILLRSDDVSTLWRSLSDVTIWIQPSRIQQLPMPKCCLASINTLWRVLVKNSDCGPIEFSFCEPNLTADSSIGKLTTIGLGFLSKERPRRYEALILMLEKLVRFSTAYHWNWKQYLYRCS